MIDGLKKLVVDKVDRQFLQHRYLELGNLLPTQYPELNFKNHCYWRIALDNALQNKWTLVIERPAYKNIPDSSLLKTIEHLESYLVDKALLIKHNDKSLHYRQFC